MNITIKLVATHGRLSTREPFLVVDNEELEITLETERAAEFTVSMHNGNVKANIKAEREFIVPRELLIGGQLEMIVSQFANGQLVKQWQVEPITIVETAQGFEGFALINSLAERLSALETLKADYNTLKTNQQALQKLCRTNAQALNELAKVIKEN